MRLLRVKRLLSTCTACTLELACGFLQSLGDSFDVLMMFVVLFDVATTVELNVHRFVRHSDDRRA